MTNDLAIQKTDTMAAARPAPTVADMLQGVLQSGVTADNVAVLKEVMALYERVEEKNAEKEFAKAFVALQSEMQNVHATRSVPGRDGTVRYKFAPFEEIMREVGPRLKTHGFTVTFSTDYADGRLIKHCTLQHIGGHSKTNKFAVRVGSGPPNSSEAQGDGAASTYAKRFALADALNIQIDHDTDARAEGGKITPGQASDLRRRVRETGSNEPGFLKFAGASEFEDIPAAKYNMLDDQLRRKENTAKQP